MSAAGRTSKPKRTDGIMRRATDRLLRAAKKRMLAEHSRINYAKLARDGFSPAMIERMKAL